MESENTGRLREAIERVFCEHRIDLIPNYYHPEFRAEFPPPLGVLDGLDAHRRLARETCEAFPDFHEEILDVVAAGDKVIGRFLISGTQARPVWGFPCHDRRFEVLSVDIYQFERGLVRYQWGVMDALGMYSQLAWI